MSRSIKLWMNAFGTYICLQGNLNLQAVARTNRQLLRVAIGDTWAIPRAGLKPAGDGDAPPHNILLDDEKVTAETVEDIFSKDNVFEHRMVTVDKRDEDGRVKTDDIRRYQTICGERSKQAPPVSLAWVFYAWGSSWGNPPVVPRNAHFLVGTGG